MKVTIKNNKTSDFHTLVMYSNPYLPSYQDYYEAGGSTTEENYIQSAINIGARSSGVLYKYSSSQVNVSGFTEYDFKFFPNKNKYSDVPKLEYLSSESKEYIGADYKDLYNIESYMFPTVTEDNTDSPISYFSFYTKGPQEIYVFNIPSGVSKLELYSTSCIRNIVGDHYTSPSSVEVSVPEYSFIDGVEFLDSLDPPVETIKPDVIIDLGPDFSDTHNKSAWYYQGSGISWVFSNPTQTTDEEWVALKDEIERNKIVYLIITHDIDQNGEEEIRYQVNLSYSAWLESINPNRNKWKYSLRNDEFGSVVSPISQDTLGFMYDETSGTLVGTGNKIISPPILRRRSVSDRWNKKNKYWAGDKVKVGEMEFVSLCNDNIGNHPCTSGKWIKANYLETSVLSLPVQVVVPKVNDNIPGETDPKGIINVPKQLTNSYRKLFNYTLNPGYQFSRLSSTEGGHDMVEASEGYPYDYSKQTILNADGTISYQVTVENWSKPKGSGYLYFNYDPVPGKLVVMVGIINNTLRPEDAGPSGNYDFQELVENYNISWNKLESGRPVKGYVLNRINVQKGDNPPVVYDDVSGNIDPSDKVIITFTGQIASELYDKIASVGVIYQSPEGKLIYSSEGITLDKDPDPYGTNYYYYTLKDSNFHYPVSYSQNDSIIYPRYSIILAPNTYAINFLTNSNNIFYQSSVIYRNYGNRNRFSYSGRKSQLGIVFAVRTSSGWAPEAKLLNVGGSVDLYNIKVLIYWDSASEDYQIRIDPLPADIIEIVLTIDEI